MLATGIATTGAMVAHESTLALEHWLPIIGIVLAGWVYWRGWSATRWRYRYRWRTAAFSAALAAIGVALVSPLDAMSAELASAHMVQHLLLVLFAAPLLALAAPLRLVVRGLPATARLKTSRWRRVTGVRVATRFITRPIPAWLLHTFTLWMWHAAVPYDAALQSAPVHILEHSTLLGTAVLFWAAVVRAARSPVDAYSGLALLLIFAAALQSTILAALITFASTPWYAYDPDRIRRWGLDPSSDQQLAGAIMWVPSGLVYLIAAIVMLRSWIELKPQVVRTTTHSPR